MDQSATRDSTKYPPGYGDFALHCSDNVICHFPRHLLGYMSDFFKDMFDLPESSGKDAQSSSSSDPLRLNETSQTIEQLLQHMDPKTQTQTIDPDTIVEFLKAAEKYQVPSVTEWYENEIQTKRGLVHAAAAPAQHDSIISEPLLVTNPLLVLYCAVEFNLPKSGRLALKELTECDVRLVKLVTKDTYLIPYLHGMDLRSERIELFRGFIVKLCELKQVSKTRFRGITYQGGNSPVTSPDTDRKTCARCTAARAAWIFRLEAAVRARPTWASFMTAYEISGGDACAVCETSTWANYYRDLLNIWERRVKATEKELPAWPYSC